MAIIRNITMANKDHLNLIITGHIDNGKSTTMGHLGVGFSSTVKSSNASSSVLPLCTKSEMVIF